MVKAKKNIEDYVPLKDRLAERASRDIGEPVEMFRRVITEAHAIVIERGFTPSYSYVSGSPVDINKAIGLAEARVDYSTRHECPIAIIGEWLGQAIWSYSSDFDFDSAVAFLVDVASRSEEIFETVKPSPPTQLTTDPSVKRPPVERVAAERICQDCGSEMPRKRGRVPKYCDACKPKHVDGAK